jgi:biopolymer transport protein ExbB
MLGRRAFAPLIFAALLSGPALAQKAEDPSAPAPADAPARNTGVSRKTVLSVFRPDNPMLWPLAICSIVTLGFALERTIALRRGRVVPRDFVARFTERLASGKLDRDRATELCKANDSPVARIFGHIVQYWGQPAPAIRSALEFDAAGEILDLRRNCRALNGTATLAPLLGLLGTVVGMIEAFDSLSTPGAGGGSKSAALAHGISLALVTTALGLGIAIVSVAAYYLLLNKVDVLSKELDDAARPVIGLVAGEHGRSAVDRRVGGPTDIGRPARTEVL